ncbi:GNAT family N-acetyltransferase [Kutzneria kofuensis]|uniref:Ribosomal protein S18 acetylase RimI-like enzyme n=1 Tax=Kutzneria kofuensis TaxID=103725 RepID=A0A7W9KH27_9PSEU|nr:N-acetyltransferase [Kutzneria kofuensis]MBB5891679.1 ribosomal protein S18 acetylase RimI-like enzyme [Kutzneria kofuensis]
MDSITELELLCADAWPALVDEGLGQWRLRAAGGFTGRANSALTTGDPGVPIPEALATTSAFAARHGIEPAAHVTQGTETERRIREAGWQPAADHPGGVESMVMTGPLPDGDPLGEVLDKPTRQWWDLAVGEPTAAQRHVLGTGPLLGFGYVEAAAVVRGCIVDSTLHISRLSVRPALRRQGTARRLLATLGAWARDCGAQDAVLQVATHNTAAIRLYEGLGFTEHHRYGYWRP